MRLRALPLALALLVASVARAEEARLVVLHTTDLHGALTAYDYLADRPAARGLVKIATRVRAARAEGAPVLLLDAGDCIHGGPLVDFRARDDRGPEPMMAAMSRMGYDAMTVGNHEFSVGPHAMKAARAAAAFPWLAANIVRSADGKPAFQPSLVKQAGVLRVGVVGLCTPAVPFLEDSSHWAGLRFLDPVEAARHEVERLRRSERCDAVIVLAHSGLEPDGVEADAERPDENWGRRLARLVPGVDVVILGHTHRVIGSTEVEGVLLTQAGHSGEHLGRVDLTFSRPDRETPWRLSGRGARVEAISDSTAVDSSLVALAGRLHDQVRATLDEVVGEAEVGLVPPSGPSRAVEHPLWDLVHRAQLDASGADASLAASFDAAAALDAGPITLREIARIYPYDNTLVVVELTGDELRRVLEHSARYFTTYTFEEGRTLTDPDVPAFQYDTAEGVSYQIDLTRPVGQRIRRLSFHGEPLAPDRRLRVAVSSYRANGGGGFPALRAAPRWWRSERSIRELLVDYVRGQRPLRGTITRNWEIAPAQAVAPERQPLDLLVRRGLLGPDEAIVLDPSSPTTRAEAAAWIARAFGWREPRASGAFAAAPDSLEPWLDGLARHGVFNAREGAGRDRRRTGRGFDASAPVSGAEIDAWAVAAARRAGYTIAKGDEEAFRRGLTNGLAPGAPGAADVSAALTRGQMLARVANLRFPTLRILETTDFHGAMLHSGSRRSLGGSGALAAWIERLRGENAAGTVLVDGGDCFQGTMISNLAFGAPVVEQMNAIGYAATAIGNHEFDWSADTLARRVGEMRFAALGANLRERRTGRMPRWVRADTVVQRLGVRVGVLGLCYRFTPTVTLAKHVAHLRFEDDSATAVQLVPRLRKRADIVIGVGHIPASADSARRPIGGDLVRLARGVPGVEAWFGGHSHNRVVGYVGEKPVLIAGSHGQIVGVCDLVVDPVAKRVLESRPRLVEVVADSIAPDPEIEAIVARWNARVAPLADAPLGRNARRLTRERGGESGVGDFAADAIRRAAGTDIALQNTGGLRADLPEGTITRGTIFEVMPFDNLIVTVELDAAEVKLALEQALVDGRVTQVSGIRYVFDRSRPAGDRVIELTDAAGAPLASDRAYRVACNDFMATGGDNYDVLTAARRKTTTDLLVREALERYAVEMTRGGAALDLREDGRIRSVGRQTDGR